MKSPSSPPVVLAIHAHPDDVEIQCAGTLGLLKQLGCPITIATMTPGDCGSAEYSPEEISRIRRGEAKQAADMLGADYICLEFRDLSIVVDNLSRRRVTEVLRKVRPDIVMTAPPVDYMSDHEFTSRLVRDAFFAAPAPNYDTEVPDPAPALDHIPHLYYVDPITGADLYGEPIPTDFVVDVSQTFEQKIAMLACHESQRNWLRRQHGLDEYLEGCRRWSQGRGSEIGTAFGEGFRQHVGHPYPHDNFLLELLGPKLVHTTGRNASA